MLSNGVVESLLITWAGRYRPSPTDERCSSNECALRRLAKYRDCIGVFHVTPPHATADSVDRHIRLELPLPPPGVAGRCRPQRAPELTRPPAALLITPRYPAAARRRTAWFSSSNMGTMSVDIRGSL